MSCQFELFNTFSISLKTPHFNEIEEYLISEYEDYLLKEDATKPQIGIINVESSIDLPADVAVIINDSTYAFNNALYFKYESKCLRITLNDAFYKIDVELGYSPIIVFCLMEALIRMYAVNYGILFLHASSFKYRDRVFVINAFGGVGKTNLLLDILERNGVYLSDDMIAVNTKNRILPYRKRINLLHYNFEYKKSLLNKVGICEYWLISLKLLSKFKETFLYKHLRLYKFIARIHNKLNKHVSHKKLITNHEHGDEYDIDHFIWMERTFTETRIFPVSKEYYVRRMNTCLYMESTQVDDWFDSLSAINSILDVSENKQRDLLANIANINNIIGIKKNNNDPGSGVLNLLDNMIDASF